MPRRRPLGLALSGKNRLAGRVAGRVGRRHAVEIRRSRVQAMRAFRHRRWLLDEVFVKINGEKHYLRRAVEHEGEVLESFVTKRRDKKAALKTLGTVGKHETGRWLNNRAENSYQPFRRRERAMLRFRRMRSCQKFASLHGSIHNHFNQERTLISRQIFKERRAAAFIEWRQLCAA